MAVYKGHPGSSFMASGSLGLGLLLLSEDSAFLNAFVPPSCIFGIFL